jgi:hypothetical protein
VTKLGWWKVWKTCTDETAVTDYIYEYIYVTIYISAYSVLSASEETFSLSRVVLNSLLMKLLRESSNFVLWLISDLGLLTIWSQWVKLTLEDSRLA